MNWLYEFIQILICIFEAFLMFDFFSAFFTLKPIFQKKYAPVCIVLLVAACVHAVNAFDSSAINLISMQVIYLSLVLGVFDGGYLKRILYDVIANAIMVGSEFLFIILLSLPSDFSLDSVQTGQFSMIINLIGVKTIAFILFNIIKRIPKNNGNRISLKNVFLFSIVPLSMLGIMTAIAYLNIDFEEFLFAKTALLISCIFATIGNVLIFYIFDRYLLSVETLRQQELMITRLEIEQKHYEQIDEMNREHSHLIHNIRHYLNVIGEAASEENAVDILKILSELQIEFDNAESTIFCANPLLNTILNEKKKDADRKKVSMEILVEPEFSMDVMTEIDVIAVIGNLLDNALEAASKSGKGYIKVFLFAQNDNHFSVIKIINNHIGAIVQKDGVLLTGKKDTKRHGLGLRSVNALLEKYDGYLENFYDEKSFTAIVILPNVAKIP